MYAIYGAVYGIGPLELLIVGFLGLVCLALPIGGVILVVVMARGRNDGAHDYDLLEKDLRQEREQAGRQDGRGE